MLPILLFGVIFYGIICDAFINKNDSCIDVFGSENTNLSTSEFNDCPLKFNNYFGANNSGDGIIYDTILNECIWYRYDYIDTLLLPNNYIIIAQKSNDDGPIIFTIWDNNKNLIINKYPVSDENYNFDNYINIQLLHLPNYMSDTSFLLLFSKTFNDINEGKIIYLEFNINITTNTIIQNGCSSSYKNQLIETDFAVIHQFKTNYLSNGNIIMAAITASQQDKCNDPGISLWFVHFDTNISQILENNIIKDYFYYNLTMNVSSSLSSPNDISLNCMNIDNNKDICVITSQFNGDSSSIYLFILEIISFNIYPNSIKINELYNNILFNISTDYNGYPIYSYITPLNDLQQFIISITNEIGDINTAAYYIIDIYGNIIKYRDITLNDYDYYNSVSSQQFWIYNKKYKILYMIELYNDYWYKILFHIYDLQLNQISYDFIYYNDNDNDDKTIGIYGIYQLNNNDDMVRITQTRNENIYGPINIDRFTIFDNGCCNLSSSSSTNINNSKYIQYKWKINNCILDKEKDINGLTAAEIAILIIVIMLIIAIISLVGFWYFRKRNNKNANVSSPQNVKQQYFKL